MSVQVKSISDMQTVNKRRSPARRMWNRLSANKMSLVGGFMVLVVVLLAVLAPWVSPYSYQQSDFLHIYQGYSLKHWLGTDALGRDMLTRILWGLRSATIVGFGAEVVELTLGMVLGAVAGYKGGWVDNVLMRIVDVVYGFPHILLSIILVVILGRSLPVILLAVAATSWVGMARVVRSQVFAIKESGYIEAARSMGASTWTIIRRYILPNSMGPILVAVTFGIPANMMAESGMSIIGLGVQPPMPDLGELISEGNGAVFGHPYMLIGPVVVFAAVLIGFAFLGDGLRDAFDMKSRR